MNSWTTTMYYVNGTWTVTFIKNDVVMYSNIFIVDDYGNLSFQLTKFRKVEPCDLCGQ